MAAANAAMRRSGLSPPESLGSAVALDLCCAIEVMCFDVDSPERR
jgi:hypothetical protein